MSSTSLTPNELARYSRHILLPQVKREGQEKLCNSKVLLIGLGGLGSPASLYLAAAGIGNLGLADFDKVEEHNLQRQIIHDTPSIGTPKIESAAQKLQGINPNLKIVSHKEGITPENAISLFSQYDVILDGSDNFSTRYLVNDAAFFAKKPLVYGSIFQFEGQNSVFDPNSGAPCYRCLFPNPPAPGTVPNCSEAGVIGSICGIIGSIQATESIKLLLGIGESLKGRLQVLDALSMNFRTLTLKKDPECPLCGQNPTIHSIEKQNYSFTCSTEKITTMNDTEIPLEISIQETKQLLDSENPPILLDVRELDELDICKIQGSINIPMNLVPEKIDSLPKDQHILIHCHHGGRSMQVTQFLRSKGYEKTTNVAGGIDHWAIEFDSSMQRY